MQGNNENLSPLVIVTTFFSFLVGTLAEFGLNLPFSDPQQSAIVYCISAFGGAAVLSFVLNTKVGSFAYDLVSSQKQIDELAIVVASKDAEIAALKDELANADTSAPLGME